MGQYSSYLGSAGGLFMALMILMAVLMLLTIFIPIAGVLSLLALTNSRGSVKAVNTFAGLGFSGIAGFLAMMLVLSSLATNALSEYSYSYNFGGLTLSAFAFPFWVCLIGSFVLMIGTRIDLSKNKPPRPY